MKVKELKAALSQMADDDQVAFLGDDILGDGGVTDLEVAGLDMGANFLGGRVLQLRLVEAVRAVEVG